ncbi:MAG TPA: hypothetical protein VFT95_17095, partial [Micromonosporaceae bacterium]|nr:hypothetical protein [Micromonosporaceae bacterium]
MTRRRPYPDSLLPPRGRRARIGVAVVLGALLASGCTADPAPSTQDRPANRDRPAGPSLRLVSFD